MSKIIKFKAKNNFELGQQLGKVFGAKLRKLLRQQHDWISKKNQALELLPLTQKYFPQFIDELRGYAQTAKVDFEDLWTIGLEEDAAGSTPPKEKCTSIITNNLIGHTEDWFPRSADNLFLIEKQIGNLKILELFYFYTLGGNSFSVNSYGMIQLTNSMAAKDIQIGVPNYIIARWLSETRNPEDDFKKLKNIKRNGGENYIFINKEGGVFCLETTAKKEFIFSPQSPFVHTNHYITNLVTEEAYRSESSSNRFNVAEKLTPTINSINDMKNILSQPPIFRDDEKSLTIATAIIDLNEKLFHYHLLNSYGEIDFSEIFSK